MHSTSEKLFTRAKKSMPGGVNSPARTFDSVGGTPVFFEKGKGAVLTDVDGNDYIDYVGSWGPMIMGHAWKPVVDAVQQYAQCSTSFGAPTEIEVDMADLVKSMVPNVDRVRMVNSGTEATMSAIRVARGYTGRDKVIKFEGNYHGHGDSFLIKAGSGALTLGEPSSPGVTEGTARDTLVAQFNDIESVRELFENNAGEIAAVIVEPVAGNMGCIPPADGFLEGLRSLCDEHESVLIFDEVMTGFRVDPGGAQKLYGVNADMATYGKIIGGGMPVGAFGGKEEIMAMVSPDGPVYQGGTLSGNPVAMAAGATLLRELHKHPQHYEELEEKARHLVEGLHRVFSEHDISHHINHVGSMLGVFFTDREVNDFESASSTDQEFFKRFYHGMLEQGVYLPPSPFESWFLSTAHTTSQLDKTIEAAEEAVAE